ncbi:hypothetical protein KSP39_PZI005895 [Platanthera zijinensis]|uniref:Uncharacterized protein n=1 Tax=Platanthera zijinensis TaxID=2320716 RepID=A0AAP0GBC1_9ASPA
MIWRIKSGATWMEAGGSDGEAPTADWSGVSPWMKKVLKQAVSEADEEEGVEEQTFFLSTQGGLL